MNIDFEKLLTYAFRNNFFNEDANCLKYVTDNKRHLFFDIMPKEFLRVENEFHKNLKESNCPSEFLIEKYTNNPKTIEKHLILNDNHCPSSILVNELEKAVSENNMYAIIAVLQNQNIPEKYLHLYINSLCEFCDQSILEEYANSKFNIYRRTDSLFLIFSLFSHEKLKGNMLNSIFDKYIKYVEENKDDLWAGNWFPLILSIINNPNLQGDKLEYICREKLHHDNAMAEWCLMNFIDKKDISPNVLTQIIQDEKTDVYIKFLAIKNPNCPSDVIIDFLSENGEITQENQANNNCREKDLQDFKSVIENI